MTDQISPPFECRLPCQQTCTKCGVETENMCFIIQFNRGNYAIRAALAIPFSVLGRKERKSRQKGIPFHESDRKDELEVNAIAVHRCIHANVRSSRLHQLWRRAQPSEIRLVTDVRGVSADVTSWFTVRTGFESVKALSAVVVWSANLSMKPLRSRTEVERCRRLKGRDTVGHSNPRATNGGAVDAAHVVVPTENVFFCINQCRKRV